MIIPTRRVGMPHRTLRINCGSDAERHRLHSHAEHGNDHARPAKVGRFCLSSKPAPVGARLADEPAVSVHQEYRVIVVRGQASLLQD